MRTIKTNNTAIDHELRAIYEDKRVKQVTKENDERDLITGALILGAILAAIVIIGALTNTY